MKPYICLGLGILLASSGAHASWFGDDTPPPACASGMTYETAFSPSDQVTALVIKSIKSAKKSIRVSAGLFVSKAVSEALIAAIRDKKDVQIVLDKKNNSNGYSDATFLQIMGYSPRLTNTHMPFMVIDDSDVVLGNLTSISQAEDEKQMAVGVLVFHHAPELAKRYLAVWQREWDNSEMMPKR